MDRPPSNSRLPIEILGDVFRRFLETKKDTSAPHLDDLLLVCKAWRDAALCFTDLWTLLEIRLDRGKGHDEAYWLHYVKTRLERAGSTQLLNICLKCSWNQQWASIPGTKSYSYLEKLLVTLTGPNGEIAMRWRRFEYNSGNPHESELMKSRLLSFPMPALRTIVAYGLTTELVLPPTPMLSTLILWNSSLPSNITNVRYLTFEIESRGSVNLSCLSLAPNLIYLKVRCWPIFRFPPNCILGALFELEINGPILEETLQHFVAPKLRRLTVSPNHVNGLLCVALCRGIRLEDLEYLELFWPGSSGGGISRAYLSSLCTLLRQASQLKTLRFRSLDTAKATARLLVDREANLFPIPPREGPLKLVLRSGMPYELGYGVERHRSVEIFRQALAQSKD